MTVELSVFGGTGFVGSRFCDSVARPVHRVARDDRVPPTRESVYFISTTDNYGPLSDIQRDVDVNLRILLEVLNNLRDCPGHVFNFISSWFVYGTVPLPATETSPCAPQGFYGITKLAAEQLLQSFARTFGIRYRIIRLCNVYGAGDRGTSARKNALAHVIGQLARGEPVRLYNGGNVTRDYMHVHDVARAIVTVLEKAPLDTIINVGTGIPSRFGDLIALARTILRSSSVIDSVEPPAFHRAVQAQHFAMDVSRLSGLGFLPIVSVEHGIEELCRSVRA